MLHGMVLKSQLCGLCCPLLVTTYMHTISLLTPHPILVKGGVLGSPWGDCPSCSKQGKEQTDETCSCNLGDPFVKSFRCPQVLSSVTAYYYRESSGDQALGLLWRL